MKKNLLLFITLGIGLGEMFAQAPYLIYYSVDQMKMDAYIDQPFTGSKTFELQYHDASSSSKQPFCYTWGCLRTSVSNSDKIYTSVDNGYVYDYNTNTKILSQTINRANGTYIGKSSQRQLEFSIRSYSSGALVCTEAIPITFTSDLPQYHDLRYTSNCQVNTGVVAFTGFFKGTLAMVSEGKSYPKVPSNVDPLNIATSTVTIQAPEFMTSYFSPNEISWLQDGVDHGLTGYQITTGVQGTKGNGAAIDQRCGVHTYVAVVKKFNWFSNAIKIKFFPNLRLESDIVISMPKCTEVQSVNDELKFNGYISLSENIGLRRFKIQVNGLERSLYSPSEKSILKLEESPFRIVFIEQFGNDIVSCTQTFDSIQITPPEPISITHLSTRDIPCFGGRPSLSLKLEGNTTGYTLSYGDSLLRLQKGQTQTMPLMQGSRSYDFSLSDDNGCTYHQPLSFTATEPSPLLATLHIDTALCHNGPASARILASGGTAYNTENPYRYTFSVVADTQTSAVYKTSGGVSIQPKVMDKNHCEVAFPDTTLSNPEDFDLNVMEHVDNTCPKGKTGSVVLNSQSAAGHYSYTYSRDGSHYSRDSAFQALEAGTYRLYSKNQNGCLKDTSVEITQPPHIQITQTALDSVRCFGESNGTITLAITGGSGSKTLWKDHREAYMPENRSYSFSHNYDSLPDTTYWFQAQDSIGCRDSIAYSIGTRSHIQQGAAMVSPTCYESSNGQMDVQVWGGKPPYAHAWEERPELGAALRPTGLSRGTYVLRSTDQLNCMRQDTFQLTAPPALQVNLEGYPLLCKGQSLDLDAGPGSSYRWGGSKGYTADIRKITVYEGGHYWVEVRDSEGCIGTDTFELRSSDAELKADFMVATNVVKGDTVVMVNINAPIDSVRWNINPSHMLPVKHSPDRTTQEVVFTEYGEHYVEMQGYYKGCRAIKRHRVFVIHASERNKYDQAIGIKTSLIRQCGLFPNPNDGSFEVYLELNEAGLGAELILSSLGTGITLKRMDWPLHQSDRITFREDLAEGPYVLHIKVKDEVVALRFLVAYD